MRRMLVVLMFVSWCAVTMLSADRLTAQDAKSKDAQVPDLHKSLLGAWVLVGQPGDASEPQADAQMKFWGLGHFAVTKRNAAADAIDYHHMGTYTLDGDQYVESVTYAIGETESLVGKSFKFRIEVDGDTYIQHGIDNPYSEQWKRLRGGDGKASPSSDAEREQDHSAEKKNDKQFAVPADATTPELIQFMDRVRRIAPTERTAEGVRKHARKVFGAIVEAADIVIARDESEEDVVEAVSRKIAALSMLVNYDPEAGSDMEKVIEEYSQDQRPAVAALAVGQQLQTKASKLSAGSDEEARQITDEVLAYIKRFGVSQATYSTIVRVASTLGSSAHNEIAAELHEQLAPSFRDAEDESLRPYADRLLGTARRLRLLGHEMELTGTQADGEQFDWSAYRGKVVLVDFWASWCGPCLSEIPNMKANLEKYSDKGFAIVGINMDSTREPFEKCVEQQEISWVNIVSEEEGQTGWNAPLAVHYGVSGIPTAILVDQEGKVVSVRARGRELDRLLASLLGNDKDNDEADEDFDQDAQKKSDKEQSDKEQDKS